MKSARSQTNEFDAQYLFETKGTYGYGNAMWPKDYENGASSSSGSDWMGVTLLFLKKSCGGS